MSSVIAAFDLSKVAIPLGIFDLNHYPYYCGPIIYDLDIPGKGYFRVQKFAPELTELGMRERSLRLSKKMYRYSLMHR